MFRYRHLISFIDVLLLLSEPRWRPCICLSSHLFHWWCPHIFKLVVWISYHAVWSHPGILTIYFRWCNVHFLMDVVLLCWIFIRESPTSRLEEPLLIYWIYNVLEEILRILWKCIIGTRFLLVYWLFRCCVGVM